MLPSLAMKLGIIERVTTYDAYKKPFGDNPFSNQCNCRLQSADKKMLAARGGIYIAKKMTHAASSHCNRYTRFLNLPFLNFQVFSFPILGSGLVSS